MNEGALNKNLTFGSSNGSLLLLLVILPTVATLSKTFPIVHS